MQASARVQARSRRAVCLTRPGSSLYGRRSHMLACADSSVGFDSLQRQVGQVLGGQVSIGGVAGFATGYAAKRVGQMLLVVVGAQVVALQMMAQRGWISVDWKKIEKELSPHVEKEGLERVVETIRFKMPFAGAFGVGCLAGLKWT